MQFARACTIIAPVLTIPLIEGLRAMATRYTVLITTGASRKPGLLAVMLAVLVGALLIGGRASTVGASPINGDRLAAQDASPTPTDPPPSELPPTATVRVITSATINALNTTVAERVNTFLTATASAITNTPISTPTATITPVPTVSGGGVGLIAYQEVGKDYTRVCIRQQQDGKQRCITPTQGYAGSPNLSPDGKRVAYQVTTPAKPDVDIVVADIDGSNAVTITTNTAADVIPIWSPDGKQILFNTNRDDPARFQLYAMDADGKNVKRLRTSTSDDYAFDWSAAGEILFQSKRVETFDLFSLNVKSGAVKQLSDVGPANSYAPVWSPDASQIAFESNRGKSGKAQVYVMNADGTNVRNVSNSESNDFGPAWSPDGKAILFVSERDTQAGFQKDRVQLYVVTLNDGKVTRLFESATSDGRYGVSWR